MCVPCANLQLISNNQAIASSRQWQNSFEVNAVAYGKQVKFSFAVAVKGEEVEPVRYHHHRSSSSWAPRAIRWWELKGSRVVEEYCNGIFHYVHHTSIPALFRGSIHVYCEEIWL